MANWTIIAHPVARGGRRVGEHAALRLRERGWGVDLVFTARPGDAERLAGDALEAGCRRIAVCGGDGTVHEVVGALAGTDGVLGVVPCGRGNDFARALGIPRDLERAVKVLGEGQERRMDLGRVGGRVFATVACMGFDAMVAQKVRVRSAFLPDRVAYVFGMLKGLAEFENPFVRIEGEFGVFEGKILLVAVGNTPFYGGGMRIAPDADWADGQLDLCIVRAMSRQRMLRIFPRVFAGLHVDAPEVLYVRSRYVRVEAAEPLWIVADGEPVCQTPTEMEMLSGVLTVLCPRQT